MNTSKFKQYIKFTQGNPLIASTCTDKVNLQHKQNIGQSHHKQQVSIINRLTHSIG